jgi:uncharacterized protein (TIGR00251 family)
MTPEQARSGLTLIFFYIPSPLNALGSDARIRVRHVNAFETKDGLILEVLVKPRCKTFRLVAEGDEITVFCRKEPVKGKVNKEITKELSKLFRKRVEIVSGFSSRQKKLLIRDAKKSDVEPVLQSSQV